MIQKIEMCEKIEEHQIITIAIIMEIIEIVDIIQIMPEIITVILIKRIIWMENKKMKKTKVGKKIFRFRNAKLKIFAIMEEEIEFKLEVVILR